MDKVFVNGLRVYKPNDRAPDFVIANIVINRDELIEWLKSNGDTVKVDIKNGRTGKYYAEVNTYQRDKPGTNAPSGNDFKDDAIPF